jgi:hypothetical protein
MAKNLKKFVNPRFLKTVDLSLLRRLFDRHSGQLQGLDLGLLDRDPDRGRQALLDFFAGPEQNYPRGLVADLHRIAEVGTRSGMDMLLERARAINVVLVPAQDAAAAEHRIEPKHLALLAFLDHPAVFNAASDLVALMRLTSPAEFAGLDEGVEPRLDEQTRKAFEQTAARLSGSTPGSTSPGAARVSAIPILLAGFMPTGRTSWPPACRCVAVGLLPACRAGANTSAVSKPGLRSWVA